ncbi:undecaprenyldiphospho-muramoylpentapeptide beta-N-acetylglucosaminyltransferase [Candidatus Puniceispirillum sp.]|uniref:undecaprenyldiphospho-muramoylpentapeptide beta-N-acetylglucosaminyltransferase n=1 Tax=Candidatus Puniceispirillum sp. TaxID=2026719 RepID=UPI003F699866
MTRLAPLNKPLVCLAAGGTGGHVFPAIAVAETLSARGYRTQLFTDKRGAKIATASNQDASSALLGVTVIASASPFQSGIIRRLSALFKLGFGVGQCLLHFCLQRPAAIIGFGGYPSFAPLFAGGLLRVPRVLHEQNAFLGRANHLLARHAGNLALSWEGTRNLPENIHIEVTGMPVRDVFHQDSVSASAQKSAPVNKGEKLYLAVFGGSQGAAVFASLIPAAIGMLPADIKERLVITQQARSDQVDALDALYAEMGITATIAPFFADIASHIRQSDLIISRAGASSVAELAALGAPTIFIPFPHAMDDHQTQNAMQMQTLGGGLCLAENDLDAKKLARHLTDLLNDPSALTDMARKAKQLSRPDAAGSITDLIEACIKGNASSNSPSSNQGAAI